MSALSYEWIDHPPLLTRRDALTMIAASAAVMVARRGQTDHLSQKVFRNSQGIVLIEEWCMPMAHGTDFYSRKEI
jgi:hypothetical protein